MAEVTHMNMTSLLADARANHAKVVATLKSIYESMDEEAQSLRFESQLDRFVLPFDLMVQRELLKIAFSSKAKEDSIQFLNRMRGFQYDLFRYLKIYSVIHKIRWDVEYENVLSLGEEEQARVLDIAKVAILPLWEDALRALSKVDLVNNDYYKDLEGSILNVVISFLMVDESVDEIEIRRAIERIREDIFQPIIECNPDLQSKLQGE